MTYLSRHFSFLIAEFVMHLLSCCSSWAKRFLFFLLPRMSGTFPFLLFSACASCCNEHKPFFPPHVGQWFVWDMTRSFKLKELEVLIETKKHVKVTFHPRWGQFFMAFKHILLPSYCNTVRCFTLFPILSEDSYYCNIILICIIKGSEQLLVTVYKVHFLVNALNQQWENIL